MWVSGGHIALFNNSDLLSACRQGPREGQAAHTVDGQSWTVSSEISYLGSEREQRLMGRLIKFLIWNDPKEWILFPCASEEAPWSSAGKTHSESGGISNYPDFSFTSAVAPFLSSASLWAECDVSKTAGSLGFHATPLSVQPGWVTEWQVGTR